MLHNQDSDYPENGSLVQYISILRENFNDVVFEKSDCVNMRNNLLEGFKVPELLLPVIRISEVLDHDIKIEVEELLKLANEGKELAYALLSSSPSDLVGHIEHHKRKAKALFAEISLILREMKGKRVELNTKINDVIMGSLQRELELSILEGEGNNIAQDARLQRQLIEKEKEERLMALGEEWKMEVEKFGLSGGVTEEDG